jgi:predicted nucleic acid-binding protein
MLVDSSVWIDFFNGRITPQTDTLDRELGQGPIVLGDIVLAEVLQGFRNEREFQKVKRALLQFPILDMGGRDLALKSATNYRRLRARGITIRSTIDCWIATFCIEWGHELLHSDRDFDPFERVLGLRVVRG